MYNVYNKDKFTMLKLSSGGINMAKQCARTKDPSVKTDDDLKLTDNLKAASQEDKFKYAQRTAFI